MAQIYALAQTLTLMALSVAFGQQVPFGFGQGKLSPGFQPGSE
jgi:hypothetical protein